MKSVRIILCLSIMLAVAAGILIFMNTVKIDSEKAADIIESMDADDAIDVLEELEDDKKEEIISLMEEESVADIQLIDSYEEDEIGSKMTTNYISF